MLFIYFKILVVIPLYQSKTSKKWIRHAILIVSSSKLKALTYFSRLSLSNC